MDAATVADTRETLSERLRLALVDVFTGLESWRDRDIPRFTRQAVPMVQGTQRTLAAVIAAYVAERAREATGARVPALSLPADAVTGLRGVGPVEVYTRPFHTLWTALSQGHRFREARSLAATRLTEIAAGDMQLTYAHANREAMTRLPERARPRYWRRTLQGEENCALCIVAASNRYSVETLNPIHPACDCGVVPVWGRDDAATEDDERLARVHTAIRELTGISDPGGRKLDYRKLIVKEHGELGPMLVRPRDDFTGPGEIANS